MNKKEILILNSEIVTYDFENGARSFNKVEYGLKMKENSENFAGFSLLVCNLKVDSFKTTASYVGKVVQAVITEIPTKNGSKYIISQINNVAL